MVTELKEKLTKCQQPFSNTEIKLFLERNNVALLLALSYHCDQPHELRDIRVEREKKIKKKGSLYHKQRHTALFLLLSLTCQEQTS